MWATERKSKNRIILLFAVFCLMLTALCIRVGYIQIVNGEELSQKAILQQTNDEELEARRGEVTDRNGKDLAVSTVCYTLWARPSSIPEGGIPEASKSIAGIIGGTEGEVRAMLEQEKKLVKIAKYLDRDQADAVRALKLSGLSLSEESKRYYPLGNFASQLLGSVTDDNVGLTGIERQYNRYLKGISGRWVLNTDASGNPLSYGLKRYYEPEDGATVVLTIDEVIQH